MSKIEVITIATTRGNFYLPAERVSGTEFVIWRYKNAPKETGFRGILGWSVTHAQTGRAIVTHAKSKAAAVTAARELTALDVSWDFSDVEKAPKGLKPQVQKIQDKARGYSQ